MRKVVATIGPSSESRSRLEQILPMLGIARMNMSHGTHSEHQAKIENVREMDSDVQVLVDLQGPKIRLGKFPDGAVDYSAGERTHLIYDPENIEKCDRMHLYVTVPHLIEELNTDDILLFNDGYISAKVIEKQGDNRLMIEFLNNGRLSNNKGINTSTASLSVDPLTEKDLVDLEFGIKMDADIIALSFVRSGDDVRDLRARITSAGSNAKICVKVERHEAIENIDEIIAEADIVMIARGDLGVEVDITDLPAHQLMLIEKSKAAGKPCIWATQVLESMTDVPRPTRAEVTDLHTAIVSGADYTMLSAESASGHYPIESVNFMNDMWEKYSK